MEYKTIAGPIGLTAEKGEDYDEAVRKYAAIIDHQATGGWELAWIQQIPVTKLTTNVIGVIVFALIGASIGAGIGAASAGYRNFMEGMTGGGMLGGIIGGILGYRFCKNKVTEFFNMLIFSKKK